MNHAEQQFERAHLLVIRGEKREAEKLLRPLCVQFPQWEEPRRLLWQIQQGKESSKELAERRRAWRYSLGLQTGWRRLCWLVAAILLIGYGGYCGALGAQNGMERGFDTEITTMMSSRYRSYPYTRPIYVDVVYGSVLLLAGISMAVILWQVSRGAAQWEELDASDYDRFDTGY